MTLKQLRAFFAIAQTLSFAQACEHLHLSQSALSLTIKALEDELGGRLFNRTTRSVSLTAEGEVLVPLARRLLADWDNAGDQMRQLFTLQHGRVALAAMPSFAGNLLPPVLKVFNQRYPRIGVAVDDVINEQVMERVRNRHVELGIGFQPEPAVALDFQPLFIDRFSAVVAADSPLAHQRRVAWSTLLQQPFVALQRPSAVRLMLEQHLRGEGLALNVAFESHQLATVGRLVASGLGVSAAPSLCRQQMHELGARCIELYAPVIERPVGLISIPGHQFSSAARALADCLVEQLRR